MEILFYKNIKGLFIIRMIINATNAFFHQQNKTEVNVHFSKEKVQSSDNK